MSDALSSTEKPKLLIVDDDQALRTQLKFTLAKDYEVFATADRNEALNIFRRERPPVVMLDLGLPPRPNTTAEGFSTLRELLAHQFGTKVIIVSDQEQRNDAIEAIAVGAYDFLSKPMNLEELKLIVRRAFHVYRLEQQLRELRGRLSIKSSEEMLGSSEEIQEVFATIRKVAALDLPLLIVGESGTGKELAARTIHRASVRKDGPFVVINCGAIPATLLESELFGREEGVGRIESADGGTLFLAEIGNLSLAVQAKLLRFLETRHIERGGGRESIAVDARIIGASNTDLKHAVAQGRFREDLYSQLKVKIELPPLRDRGEDILLIAKVLLGRFAGEAGKVITGFTEETQQVIRSYAWPGNIRELENRVKRAVIMSESERLNASDLELDRHQINPKGLNLRQARERLERSLVQQTLARHRGNLTRAADDLGISRPTLYELMEKLGIPRR